MNNINASVQKREALADCTAAAYADQAASLAIELPSGKTLQKLLRNKASKSIDFQSAAI